MIYANNINEQNNIICIYRFDIVIIDKILSEYIE